MNSDGLATEESVMVKCPGCGSNYNGHSQFCSRSCLNSYDETVQTHNEQAEEEAAAEAAAEEAEEAAAEAAEALPLPQRPMLRRSYAYVPGQTEEEHQAMVERLDAANLAAGNTVGNANWDDEAPTPKPKRSLDDLVVPKRKAKRRKAKAKVFAVRKDFAGANQCWELTLEDGSLVLAREIVF